MTNHHAYRGMVWLDLEKPTEDEIAGVVKRYGLHPLVGEELKSSSTLAKIDLYPEYILVVLTVPVRVRRDGGYEIADREIDFVIGKNFLITSRDETIEQLEYFAKIFEANAILNKDERIEHAGHLFYYMVKRIYAGMFEDLENIRDSLLSAETRIFGGDERKMVEALSALSRELIDIKQTVRIHRDVWDELVSRTASSLFGAEFSTYARDIRDEFSRIHELIVNARELLSDLRETNDSLLNSKQNEIIKILTVVAFVFNPLIFIASLFTIPGPNVPLVNSPHGWMILVVIMALVVVAIGWFFRRKRWI